MKLITLTPDLLTLQGESFPKRIVLKSEAITAAPSSSPGANAGGVATAGIALATDVSATSSVPPLGGGGGKVLGFLTSANTLIAAEYGLWCIQCASQQEAFEILSVAFNEKEG